MATETAANTPTQKKRIRTRSRSKQAANGGGPPVAAKGQTGADPVMARNLKFLQATVIPTTPDVIQACLTLAAQQPPNTARALRYLDIVNAYRAWFEASGQQMPLATATSH